MAGFHSDWGRKVVLLRQPEAQTIVDRQRQPDANSSKASITSTEDNAQRLVGQLWRDPLGAAASKHHDNGYEVLRTT